MNGQNDVARKKNGPLIHFRLFGLIYFVLPCATNEFFIWKATCIDGKLFGVIKTICWSIHWGSNATRRREAGARWKESLLIRWKILSLMWCHLFMFSGRSSDIVLFLLNVNDLSPSHEEHIFVHFQCSICCVNNGRFLILVMFSTFSTR